MGRVEAPEASAGETSTVSVCAYCRGSDEAWDDPLTGEGPTCPECKGTGARPVRVRLAWPSREIVAATEPTREDVLAAIGEHDA